MTLRDDSGFNYQIIIIIRIIVIVVIYIKYFKKQN